MEPQTEPFPHLILGIDPGTTVMGYGLLSVADRKKAELLTLGTIEFKGCATHYDKLHRIFERVCEIIEEYHPDVLSIEAPFFGKNVQSMLKLGRAQGVAMAAALHYNLPVHEYSPLKIKMAITGSGGASKEQVADMLRRMLHIPNEKLHIKLDATDALGAAYCHFLQLKNPIADKPYKNWKDFIAKNEERIKK